MPEPCLVCESKQYRWARLMKPPLQLASYKTTRTPP